MFLLACLDLLVSVEPERERGGGRERGREVCVLKRVCVDMSVCMCVPVMDSEL